MMLRTTVLTLGLLALTACADSGALYRDAKAGYQPVAADKSRLVMYRDSSVGALVRPTVLLDGTQVRKSIAHSYTVLDIAPGNHVLSAETEVEKTYQFNAQPAQEIYVREAPGMGWFVGRIHLEPVSAAEAQKELSELHEQPAINQAPRKE